MTSSPGWVSRASARLVLLREHLDERPGVWTGVLAAALALAVTMSLGVGAAALPAADVPRALLSDAHPFHAVLWQVRVPRVVNAILVGACLAVAGTVMQTVVRNPLADPSLIGISAGAAVAALLGIVLSPAIALLLPWLALLGALGAAALVLLAAEAGTQMQGPLRIVLAGVAVQSILFACVALITFLFADRAPSFAGFTVGSLAGSGWREARIVTVPALLGIAVAHAAARPLDLLLLDDDSATGIGLPVRGARIALCSVAGLLAAGAVSIAGLVGFVGLIVPNAARILVGPSHHRLLPTVALGGAALVVVADACARTVVAPLELPVGALLALVGGPYFLVLLRRRAA
ncbi:iron ABC transporter permease [Candidatus Binatia bacterium]|nr:iron ABC transporter permease [Candidatus Binatia bacterium]